MAQKALNRLKDYAKKMKQNFPLMYLAYKNKKTPWYAKLLTLLVVAYALSPIDLIPDFIPVIGYLDDLILVPLGIVIALKMIPADVIRESREKLAAGQTVHWDNSIITTLVIVLTWMLPVILVGSFVYFKFR